MKIEQVQRGPYPYTKLHFEHEVISIHCGGNHTIINTTDGLYVFGENESGQLGLGDNINRNIPTKLEFFQRGTAIALEGITECLEIISVQCGCYHTIVKTIGGLYVFGCNEDGQLGLGDYIDRNIPTKLEFDHDIISISCGSDKTMINTEDGLYVFGANDYGQLGLGDYDNRNTPTLQGRNLEIVSIHCCYNHTILHATDGLYVFGNNELGQLGLGNYYGTIVPKKLDFFHEILFVSCGQDHTIMNTTDGLYVFGENNYGQLGLGDNIHRNIPTKLDFFSTDFNSVFDKDEITYPAFLGEDSEIISISCNYHSTIINTFKGLYMFGYNKNGQLGLGDKVDRNIPTKLDFPYEIIGQNKRHIKIKSTSSSI